MTAAPIDGALCSSAPAITALQSTHSPGKGGFGLLATRASRFQEKAGINHAPDIPRK